MMEEKVYCRQERESESIARDRGDIWVSLGEPSEERQGEGGVEWSRGLEEDGEWDTRSSSQEGKK